MKLKDYVLRIIGRLLLRFELSISRTCLTQLKQGGKGISLGRGVQIEHPEFVSLGDRVHLNDYCWLSVADSNYNCAQPVLSIGSDTYIGRFATLACINRLIIGRNVLISDRVFIGDAAHGFLQTSIPIKEQRLTSPGPVTIGDGSWIGIGVSILPNVAIGRNCVIGANSVVTRDIPDFCVVVGNPAKVIRSLVESS